MPMGDEIKIFVSRRIDLDSTAVDNPLYVPVRCGAVFDKNPDSPLLGDNTGDNISEKRMTLCEFTVQYWAWKNVEADYYGLCHYRRYLSFGAREEKPNDHGLVPCPMLNRSAMARYGLTDADKMRSEIKQYDLLYPQPAPVAKMPLPRGTARTVRELWDAHDGIFFEKKVIDRMFELIDELFPEYSASARAYFDGEYHIGYNCYIMRRALFERLCQFQFPIMEALERELDLSDYTAEMRRTPAYVGEMLFGVFVYHLLHCERWRTKSRQLVLFGETRDLRGAERIAWYGKFWLDRGVRKVVAPFFPLGSKRREACKKIYYRLTGRK